MSPLNCNSTINIVIIRYIIYQGHVDAILINYNMNIKHLIYLFIISVSLSSIKPINNSTINNSMHSII